MMTVMESQSGKVRTLHELGIITRRLKKAGKKIVLCHGVFDLVHPGHIRYFSSAKKHGDILAVTLTADRFVKKGPGRPVFNEKLRAEFLATIEMVDYVAVVHSDSAIEAIHAIRPDVYVKGPDYKYRKPNPAIPRKLGEEEEAVASHGGKLVFTDDILFSSSHLINQYLDVYDSKTKVFLDGFKMKYTNEYLIEKLLSIQSIKTLIIGDAIIDQYVYSKPLGKSYKEPIVVHKFLEEESYAGGALATANHVAALSNTITLVTVLGKNHSFEPFIRKHLRPVVTPKFFYRQDASTIVKRRYIDQYTNQKLFQVSYINDEEIPSSLEQSVATYLKKEIPKHDIVVVNDFGHGFITRKIIRLVCEKSKFLCLNVQANSANYGFHIITKYPKADFVCIDDLELRLATHDRYGEQAALMKRVYDSLHCKTILVTRGPYGSTIYSKTGGQHDVPAFTGPIVDRVGAGDALFSIVSPLAYIGLPQEAIAFIGNVAAALKIQTIGNKTPTDFKELTKFITRLLK